MRAVALIVAAGSGERFGGSLPKQYAALAGQSVLRRSVELFLNHPEIAGTRVIIQPAHRDLYEQAVVGLDLPPPVIGGGTRQASGKLGLEALVADPPDIVLIHDAARPLASSALVSRVVAALSDAEAVLPAVAVADTLKRGEGDAITGEVARAGLFRAQTPQGFRFGPILAAHRRFADHGATDDVALAAAAGIAIRRVDGEETNLKITTPGDHALAERLLCAATAWRSGFGYDVHVLVAGRPLVLCGVTVPSEQGLDGHSDADVALHALTDAILGTIGAGDIGTHFPPSDERWRGAASHIFVRHALDLARQAGGALENADLTILAERPKIGPHRDAMLASLEAILGIDRGRIGLKATTGEGIGFVGRGEGIAAHAVVSLRFGA